MMLTNKIAVVTGNPYGIGRVTAELFMREGARVVCLDDSRTGWSGGAGEIELPHFVVDVSDAKAVAAVVAQCEQTLGHIDILFNLAGRATKQSFEATTDETWNRMLARNLSAAFVC